MDKPKWDPLHKPGNSPRKTRSSCLKDQEYRHATIRFKSLAASLRPKAFYLHAVWAKIRFFNGTLQALGPHPQVSPSIPKYQSLHRGRAYLGNRYCPVAVLRCDDLEGWIQGLAPPDFFCASVKLGGKKINGWLVVIPLSLRIPYNGYIDLYGLKKPNMD